MMNDCIEKPVVPYQPAWKQKFETEAGVIKSILGDDALDIQHIGSTSVEGLSAKPIIDIAVLTNSITNPVLFAQKLETIGYIYKPDMSSAERIFLRKSNPAEYHLSISEPRYSYWKRQTLFRDYLRRHPEAANEYEEIKEQATSEASADELRDLSMSVNYNSKKAPFIEKVLKLAEQEQSWILIP